MSKLVRENINDYLPAPSEEEIEKRTEKASFCDLAEKAAKYGDLRRFKIALNKLDEDPKLVRRCESFTVGSFEGLCFNIAVAHGNLNILKYLVEKRSYDAFTSFQMDDAIKGGYLDVVKYLAGKGVNIDYEDINTAEKRGHHEVAQYLEKIKEER